MSLFCEVFRTVADRCVFCWWWWRYGPVLCTAVTVNMGPASVSVCLQSIGTGKAYKAKGSSGMEAAGDQERLHGN